MEMKQIPFGPPIDSPCDLEDRLVEAVRKVAFGTYVNFGPGPSERRKREARVFAAAIAYAVTVKFFDAYQAAEAVNHTDNGSAVPTERSAESGEGD
jgi:hypothetical protein